MKLPITRAVVVAAALALALVTASCGSEASESGTQSETTSDTKQAHQEIKTEKLEGELVDSFPDDIPLYDGEIMESKGQMGEVSGAPEWSVFMSTDDPIETVNESLRADYSSNGWKIGHEIRSGSSHQFTASNSDYIISVTYNDMFGTITYGVSAKG